MILQKGGLAPLHIAVAIPGEEGVQITQLLLDALADPDARALQDDSFLNKNLVSDVLHLFLINISYRRYQQFYFYCTNKKIIWLPTHNMVK